MVVRCSKLNGSRPERLRIIVAVFLLQASVAALAQDARILPDEQNSIVLKASPWGEYWQFAPRSARHILVIVHGTIGKNETARDAAHTYILRWTEFAQRKRMLLLSPAFDNPNYQAASGGYRGLFGHKYGADDFVNNIVDLYSGDVSGFDGKFFLYGHSAGGQFACRYSVRHPDRLRGVVLSAPGRYAFPDSTAPWPYGMGKLRRDLHWNKSAPPQKVAIYPDPQGWVAAASLPFTVVVGDRDLDPQPRRPGHRGTTRVELARNWVNDMQEFAAQYAAIPEVDLVIVPGVGHTSNGLTQSCQQVLARAISKAQIQQQQSRDRRTP